MLCVVGHVHCPTQPPYTQCGGCVIVKCRKYSVAFHINSRCGSGTSGGRYPWLLTVTGYRLSALSNVWVVSLGHWLVGGILGYPPTSILGYWLLSAMQQ